MKFKIKKILTIFMSLSTFSHCVFGMEENTGRIGWNVLCKSNSIADNNKIDIILFSKNGHSIIARENFANIPQNNSDSCYCDKCNLQIMNKKENALGFWCKECKICLSCAIELSKKWNDIIYYKCKKHKKAISDINIICCMNAKMDYVKSTLELDNLILMGDKDDKKNKEEVKKVEKANKEAFDKYMGFLYPDYDKWSKKDKSKMKGHFECKHTSFDELKRYEDSYLIKEVRNMVSLAFENNRNNDVECPICCSNNKPVCILQCGHAVCSKCLTDFSKKKKICPTCKRPFSKIIVLREKMDGISCPKFIDLYKQKIQDCIADE